MGRVGHIRKHKTDWCSVCGEVSGTCNHTRTGRIVCAVCGSSDGTCDHIHMPLRTDLEVLPASSTNHYWPDAADLMTRREASRPEGYIVTTGIGGDGVRTVGGGGAGGSSFIHEAEAGRGILEAIDNGLQVCRETRFNPTVLTVPPRVYQRIQAASRTPGVTLDPNVIFNLRIVIDYDIDENQLIFSNDTNRRTHAVNL